MRASAFKDLGRFFLSAALFCGPLAHAESKVLKVGVLLSDTGDLKATAIEMRRAVQLAARLFNEKHAGKAEIQFVFADDASRVQGASTKAEWLVRDQKVDAVIGPSFLAGASVSAPLFATAGIPVIVPLARTQKWGETSNTRFLQIEESRMGAALAGFARRSLSAKNAALVDDLSSDSSKAFNDGFKTAFDSKKTPVKDRLGYVSAANEAPQLLAALSKLKVDVVSLPSTQWDAARVFLGTAAAAGVSAVFLGSSAWSPSGPAIGHFFVDIFSVTLPASRDFVEIFHQDDAKDLKNKAPDPSRLAALSFEAVSIFGQAFDRAGLQTKAPLQKALDGPAFFEGVSGKLRFRSDGTPERDILVLETTKSGIPRYRETLSSAAPKPVVPSK
ncbi:MAG: ABC transporter substrate-binding protein [Bdellovibrionota bacterium]